MTFDYIKDPADYGTDLDDLDTDLFLEAGHVLESHGFTRTNRAMVFLDGELVDPVDVRYDVYVYSFDDIMFVVDNETSDWNCGRSILALGKKLKELGSDPFTGRDSVVALRSKIPDIIEDLEALHDQYKICEYQIRKNIDEKHEKENLA